MACLKKIDSLSPRVTQNSQMVAQSKHIFSHSSFLSLLLIRAVAQALQALAVSLQASIIAVYVLFIPALEKKRMPN
jgi:hypothetical protein